jgi:vacuolar-type H+-ATPase catalytic subunit A/Vma1
MDDVQVYEETAGLTVGDVVTRTKKVRQMQQNLDMQQSMQTQRL